MSKIINPRTGMQYYTEKEMCKMIGTNYYTYRNRKRRGWSVEL